MTVSRDIMLDAETALMGEEVALEIIAGNQTSSNLHPNCSKEHSLTKSPSTLIPLTSEYTEEESKPDVGNNSDERQLPSKTIHSCYCCWPQISPFFRQMILSIVMGLGGLAIGTIYAYPAVALARWEDADFKLTTTQSTWFASTPMVVAVVVSVLAGVVVERLGARLCLIIGTCVLCLTWIMIGQATDFWVLLLARVIQGVVASVNMVMVVVYPAEVSQVEWRGIMIGVIEAMIMLGALLTYLGGLIFSPSLLAYTFAAVLVPQLILFFFLRESPLWLARRNREDDIVESLTCLRGDGVDMRSELELIKSTVCTGKVHDSTSAEQLMLLFRKPVYLRPITLCVLVLLFKELTGQYAAIIYTVKMFQLAGSTLDPYWCAVVTGAMRFLPCFLSWILVEKLPRRLLMSICMTVTAISLAVLGTFLLVWPDSSNDLRPHMGLVPIVCLSIFTLAYGIGVGPISWTIVEELLPSQVRNIGTGITNTCFSIFQSIVGLTFPLIVMAVGVGGVFIAYSLCSACGVLFVITCLPETQGRSFTEIQTKFRSSKENVRIV